MLGLCVGVASSGSAGADDRGAPTEARSGKPVASDWCSAPLRALDAETCFTLPERPTRELLIYLHGLVPPSKQNPQKKNLYEVVANAAARAGIAALVPRGIQHRSGAFRSFWGWPTGAAYTEQVSELVARFERNRQALEAKAGARFTRVYVAGSSAGAYFATALALRGDYSAHGYAALSGAGGKPRVNFDALPPAPFYIGYGSFDRVAPEARALARALESAGWPVKLAEHKTGHGAREVYLDEAFAFFRGGGR